MVIFLIPVRIVGHYFRDFFTAKKFLSLKNYEKSIEYNKLFLQQIEDRPWIKRLMWLSWGMYTKDIEAMSFNNIGTSLFLSYGSIERIDFIRKRLIITDILIFKLRSLVLLSNIAFTKDGESIQ